MDDAASQRDPAGDDSVSAVLSSACSPTRDCGCATTLLAFIVKLRCRTCATVVNANISLVDHPQFHQQAVTQQMLGATYGIVFGTLTLQSIFLNEALKSHGTRGSTQLQVLVFHTEQRPIF